MNEKLGKRTSVNRRDDGCNLWLFFGLFVVITWISPSLATAQSQWTPIPVGPAVNGPPLGVPAGKGWAANIALLTDGRLLVSGSDNTSTWNQWWTLTPDSNGSYATGTWTRVGDAAFGRVFNPAFILRDGRYWVCGGEYVCPASDLGCAIKDGNWSDCEIFDPIANTWSLAPDMSAGGESLPVNDRPSALTNSGVLVLAYDMPGNGYGFMFEPASSTWSLTAQFNSTDIPGESGSLLLPDGSVLAGSSNFDLYHPTTNQWTAASGLNSGYFFTTQTVGDEIGPFLLLYDGRALILGANSMNGLYDYRTGLWSLYPNIDMTPTGPDPMNPYNHGDTPACVEPNGKVLTMVTNDQTGIAQTSGFMYEWDPSVAPGNGNQWSTSFYPPITSQKSGDPERNRMLVLPRGNLSMGQVLVNGAETNGTMWLYTPTGSPPASSPPTITTAPVLFFGQFMMSGTQLNGLTNGGDFGDDGKTATNFPIVSLWDNSGHIFYARTLVDQVVPTTGGLGGTCWFVQPPGLGAGAYNVHVSASGVDSSNTASLTLPAMDEGPAFLASITIPLST